MRDLGRGRLDERCRGGRDPRPVGGIIDDDQDARARRGGRRDRERIRGGTVQGDRGVEGAGQGRELGGEAITVVAIRGARVRGGPVDRGRAAGGTEGDRHGQPERAGDPGTSAHAANVACCPLVNAVSSMVARMPPETIRRLAALRVNRFEAGARSSVRRSVRDIDQAIAEVRARWAGDLCGLLNAMTRGELADLAIGLRVTSRVPSTDRSPALRLALWEHGAALERGGCEVSPAVQPRPILLGGHLVVHAAPRGMFPTSAAWPRPLPDDRPTMPAERVDEPETLDELLAAADRLIGVRLGRRGRDKGAWGTRAASLLGVIERGHGEPDWRGDVEVKTVPVAQEPTGHWRVVEDPAIAMIGERGLSKLQRTLWLARASIDQAGDPDDATIVSWYLLDWDAEVARLARRYLHARPKGPAGTTARGLYMHKRFFAETGMLATLNGWGS